MGNTAVRPEDILTMEEIRQFKETFSLYDADHTGTIDCNELKQVLIALGQDPTPDELNQMMEDMDSDGNGTIDINEFLNTMAKKSDGLAKEIKLAFHVFDRDGDGYITADDIVAIFESIGEKLTPRQMHRLLKVAGADAEGRVAYQSFTEMMKAPGSKY